MPIATVCSANILMDAFSCWVSDGLWFTEHTKKPCARQCPAIIRHSTPHFLRMTVLYKKTTRSRGPYIQLTTFSCGAFLCFLAEALAFGAAGFLAAEVAFAALLRGFLTASVAPVWSSMGACFFTARTLCSFCVGGVVTFAARAGEESEKSKAATAAVVKKKDVFMEVLQIKRILRRHHTGGSCSTPECTAKQELEYGVK